MKSKSKNVYERIFNCINNKANNLIPQFIKIVYEMNGYIALKNIFKESKILLFFYFTRFLFWRTKRLGLTKLNEENIKIRKFFNM